MKFISKCVNQVLCIKPKHIQIVDGVPFPVEGEHVRFVNYEFETEDEKVIDFIKRHSLFNSSITESVEVKGKTAKADTTKTEV